MNRTCKKIFQEEWLKEKTVGKLKEIFAEYKNSQCAREIYLIIEENMQKYYTNFWSGVDECKTKRDVGSWRWGHGGGVMPPHGVVRYAHTVRKQSGE